jgi:hypothetical protein
MHQEANRMKKLALAAALSVAVIAPAAALAQDPNPADFKNAAKFCKAFKAGAGTNNFAAMFGTKKNAYGKCVSKAAKRDAEDAAQAKQARAQAVEECRAVKTPGSKNAFGKCVSEKAKAKKAAADEEDEAQEDDKINAAQTCKAAKKDDATAFAAKWGSRKNAFGKCVSATAKELAAQRKAERNAPAPTA